VSLTTLRLVPSVTSQNHSTCFHAYSCILVFLLLFYSHRYHYFIRFDVSWKFPELEFFIWSSQLILIRYHLDPVLV